MEDIFNEDEFWKSLEQWISFYEIPLMLCEPLAPWGVSEEDREYYTLIRTLTEKKHHFQNELATLMREKNITKNSELYNSVNMSCALFGKIIKAKEGYVPDKETVFKLCIALHFI